VIGMNDFDFLPPCEHAEARRSMLRWQFATILHDRLWQKRHDGVKLSDAELYALDLYAESVGMPISWLDKALQGNLSSGFQNFLYKRKSSDVDYAMLQAEDLFMEQSLAEPDKKKDGDRYRLRCLKREFLDLVRDKVGTRKDEDVELVEMMVYLFESHVEVLWKSHYVTNKYGRKSRWSGRKEIRKSQERLEKSES